jgi:hypothetical protein
LRGEVSRVFNARMFKVLIRHGTRGGMMRALNRHVAREFNSDRKDTHLGKRKLKRDEADRA